MTRRRKILLAALVVALPLVAAGSLSLWVEHVGDRYRCSADAAPTAQTAIVLGAYVHPDGLLSDMLLDRVRVGVDLYKQGRVQRLLMSGDHGSAEYDEVNAMRLYAEKAGVPPEAIFLDHAGFSTYDTMVRARKVFEVRSAIVVTQDFHLSRAIYLARAEGIEAWGVAADLRPYYGTPYYAFRDAVARCKAGLNVAAATAPTFLGPPIPITGDGLATRG